MRGLLASVPPVCLPEQGESVFVGAMTVDDLVQAALGGQENDDQSDLSWK